MYSWRRFFPFCRMPLKAMNGFLFDTETFLVSWNPECWILGFRETLNEQNWWTLTFWSMSGYFEWVCVIKDYWKKNSHLFECLCIQFLIKQKWKFGFFSTCCYFSFFNPSNLLSGKRSQTRKESPQSSCKCVDVMYRYLFLMA